MKPQMQQQPQPDTIVIRLHDPAALADLERDAALVRLMLLADPAYQAWSEARAMEGERAYDEWFASPKGQRWLEEEAAVDAERRCTSEWEGW